MNGPEIDIESRARAMLNPVLSDCVLQRTAIGVAKYGQRLDDNHQPERDKAIHFIQEQLDALQYALWMGEGKAAQTCANLAKQFQERHRLSAEEIMAGGKI